MTVSSQYLRGLSQETQCDVRHEAEVEAAAPLGDQDACEGAPGAAHEFSVAAHLLMSSKVQRTVMASTSLVWGTGTGFRSDCVVFECLEYVL